MIYGLSWWFFRFLFRVLGSWKVAGEENVPRRGAAILAPNHLSFLDPPIIGCSLRRPAWFVGKEELFCNDALRWFLPKMHAFPIKRGAPDPGALKKSMQILARGDLLCIFPEGTRQEAGTLGEPEMGVGLLAVRTGVPVIPVYIHGTDKMLPRGGRGLRRAEVGVRYGLPIVYGKVAGKPGRDEYMQAAREIMERIAQMARGDA